MVNYLEPDHFSVETALDHRLSGMAIAWRQHPQREKASGVSSRVVDSNQPSNYAFRNKSNPWNLEVSFFMEAHLQRLSSGYRVRVQIICIVIRLPVLVRQWVTNHNIFLGLSYLTKETLHFLSRLARIKFTCSATSGNRRGEEIQKKFVRARSKKLPSS